MGSVALEVAQSSLLVLSALFPIVNPLGSTPFFLSLTPGYSSAARTVLARKIALNSFWLLAASMLIGSHILSFFGISLPVVQVGGGLVVISTGWALLHQEDSKLRTSTAKVTPEDIANRAFYPLTLPLTVGPGSLSVALTLGANQSGHETSVARLIAAVAGPVLVAVTIYLSYRFAESIARLLGPTTMNVIIRLSSFILLCIGVQITWNGVHALLTLK